MKPLSIELGPGITLPADLLTEKIGILASPDAGKTYTGGRIVECLLDMGAQVVMIDNVGVWYGLQTAANGKDPGYDIPVFGGTHGDIPLEHTAGALMAETIVETGMSAVLDMTGFSSMKRATFVADFLERLLDLKQSKKSPMMLGFEEIQLLASQNLRGLKGDHVRCLGAIEKTQQVGRNYGIGTMGMSQRSQAVNKQYLDLVTVMIALRTTAVKSRKPIVEWAEEFAGGKDLRDALGTLPELETGDFFLWWPKKKIYLRGRASKKKTFDTSRTPSFDEAVVMPTGRAKIDLDALLKAMKESLDHLQESDPKHLKARIKELEARLAKSGKAPAEAQVVTKTVEKRVEVSVLSPDDRAAILEAQMAFARGFETVSKAATVLEPLLAKAIAVPSANGAAKTGSKNDLREALEAQGWRPREDVPEGRSRASNLRQAILEGIAQLNVIGMAAPRADQVGLVVGKSPKGGYFRNTVSSLRTDGLVDYRNGGLVLTDQGRAAAGPVQAPLRDSEVQDRVLAMFSGLPRDLLAAVIRAYPGSVSREDLGELVGKASSGGYFRNSLSKLSSFGVVEYVEGGRVVASSLLFPRLMVAARV